MWVWGRGEMEGTQKSGGGETVFRMCCIRKKNWKKQRKESFPVSALCKFTKFGKSQTTTHPRENFEPNKRNHFLPIFTVSSKTNRANILTFYNQRSGPNLQCLISKFWYDSFFFLCPKEADISTKIIQNRLCAIMTPSTRNLLSKRNWILLVSVAAHCEPCLCS